MRKAGTDSAANMAASISVIILVGDAPQSLRESIASVACQACPDIELVVVNHGVADLADSVGESAAGSFRRVIYRPLHPAMGKAEAANAGLDLAAGKYVLFLRNGDRLEPGHLSNLRNALEADGEAVLAYSATRALDVEGKVLATFEDAFPPWLLMTGNPLPPHAALFRQSAAEAAACRFDPQFEACADWDFLMQLQMAGKFAHAQGSVAAYLGNSDGSCGTAMADLHSPDYRTLMEKWRFLWPDAWLAGAFEATHGLPALQRKIAELKWRLDTASVALDYKTTALDQQAKALASCQQSLDAIMNSRIWRLTSGFRALGTRLKKWLSCSSAAPARFEPAVRDYHHGHHEADAAAPGLEPQVRDDSAYDAWIAAHDTLSGGQRQGLQAIIQAMCQPPLISVLLPIGNPPLGWLKESIESVRAQIYPQWELCIVGDASEDAEAKACLEHYARMDKRVRVLGLAGNNPLSRAGITALNMATGEFFAMLAAGDTLSESALYCVAQAIQDHPDVGIIYSDEDALDADGKRHAPRFKPDWNYELFLGHDFIGHLLVCDRHLAYEAGGFRAGFAGAHAYDLTLRCVERLQPGQIVHIPRILYHARLDARPDAQADGLAAVNEHLSRTCPGARAEIIPNIAGYKIEFPLPEPAPLVSIIIPTRNRLNLIRPCLESIFAKTRYLRYDILVVDNGSDDAETLEYLHGLEARGKIRILRDDRPFNFAALTNAGVAETEAEFVLLLNNDVEVIAEKWMDELVRVASRPGIGAVGARLWYPDDTLQHGGILLGLDCIAWHAHVGLPRHENGYCNRASLMQSLSAVTAACLLIRRSLYLAAGGLDEEHLAVDFNDVDFCLRLREAGYRNVWTPFAELYHHESASRGDNLAPEHRQRAEAEAAFMQEKWGNRLQEDPAYNPNLKPKTHFALASKPRLPALGRHA